MEPSATVTSSIKARPRCFFTFPRNIEISVSLKQPKRVESPRNPPKNWEIYCIFPDCCAGSRFEISTFPSLSSAISTITSTETSCRDSSVGVGKSGLKGTISSGSRFESQLRSLCHRTREIFTASKTRCSHWKPRGGTIVIFQRESRHCPRKRRIPWRCGERSTKTMYTIRPAFCASRNTPSAFCTVF